MQPSHMDPSREVGGSPRMATTVDECGMGARMRGVHINLVMIAAGMGSEAAFTPESVMQKLKS